MNKEELQKIVNESKYLKDVMQKLNFSNMNAYAKVRKILDEHNIDYSKLISNAKNHGCIIEYSLDEILTENSPYKGNGPKLKNKLIEAGLKENKCENPECGISEWRGHPLALQLHHINGDRTDNRLSNLQLLCPNCHSQTDNFAGKNSKRIKEKYYCSKCGKEISTKGAKLCVKCNGEEKRKSDRPSKEELFKLIKTKPFTEIGRIYNVSDNAVRKWCKQENLPYLRSEIKKLL